MERKIIGVKEEGEEAEGHEVLFESLSEWRRSEERAVLPSGCVDEIGDKVQ